MKDGGKTFRGTLNPLARRALAFAVMYVYFEYWDYKSKIRQSLNIGALAIFSISGLVMAFDIGGEIAGTNRIKILFSTVDAHPHLKLGLQLLFVAAACYGVIHHLLEMRKPGYEFNCMQVLCDLMENQRAPVSRPLFDVLSLCHTVFERAGIFHVAVALPPETPCEKIVLTIDPKHVYPPENSEAFYIPLPLEASVAGKVARASTRRSVPKLYFPFGKKRKHIPTWPFPHAVMYKYEQALA